MVTVDEFLMTAGGFCAPAEAFTVPEIRLERGGITFDPGMYPPHRRVLDKTASKKQLRKRIKQQTSDLLAAYARIRRLIREANMTDSDRVQRARDLLDFGMTFVGWDEYGKDMTVSDAIVEQYGQDALAVAFAERGIVWEQRQAPPSPVISQAVFEVYSANGGLYRWRLKTADNEIVCAGQAHQTRDDAHHECETVKRIAAAATIEDHSVS